MSQTTHPPKEIEALQRQILQAEDRLDRLDHALRERRQALQAQIESVSAPLKAAGLDSPEAIADAFQQLEASEREDLLRQNRQASAAPAAPAADKKQRVRFGRTV